MKINAILEVFEDAPKDILTLRTKSGETYDIKLEDIQVNGQMFFCEDAYFLGEKAGEIEKESEFIFEEGLSIDEDVNAGLMFSSIDFADDAGTCTASFYDGDMGERLVEFTYQAASEREATTIQLTSDEEGQRAEEAENQKEDATTQDIAEESEKPPMEDANFTYDADGNLVAPDGFAYGAPTEQYPSEHDVAFLSHSVTPQEKMALIKEMAQKEQEKKRTKQKVRNVTQLR